MSRTIEFMAENASSAPFPVCDPDKSHTTQVIELTSAPWAARAVKTSGSRATTHCEPASPTRNILVVSADDYLRTTIRAFLDHMGFSALGCLAAGRALQIFSSGPTVDLLLVDVHSLGAAAITLASECCRAQPDLPVILLAGPESENGLSQSMQRSGWTRLNKPVLLPVLLGMIQKAFDPLPEVHTPSHAAAVLPFPPASESAPRCNPVRRKLAGQSRTIAMKHRPH